MKLTRSLLFLIILVPAIAKGQVDLNNGLVVHLPFSGNFQDAGPNGINATPMNGVQFTADRFGNAGSAIVLDGIDDYVTVSDQLGKMSTTPFSIVLWFQPRTTNYQILIGKRDFGVNNGQQYQLSVFRSSPAGLFSGVTNNAIGCPGSLSLGVLSAANYPDPFCIDQWHCVIITFDGSFHRMYFDGALVRETVPNFNTMLACNSDLRLGNWWVNDPLFFDGKMDDFRWYNRVLTRDEVGALSVNAATQRSDFILERDACNPDKFIFSNISSFTANVNWRFGDGNISSNGNLTSHTYASRGVFPVTMFAESPAGCRDSVTRQIDTRLGLQPLIQTQDTTACVGSTIRLRLNSPAAALCWQPQPGLTPDGTGADAVIRGTSSYYIYGQALGPELVINSNFNSGNTGFTTGYQFNVQRSGDGQFGVTASFKQWNPDFTCTDCPRDHTGDNTGYMLVGDGSTVNGTSVWCQQIPVQPGKIYQVSFWGIAERGIERARPALFVNGNRAGQLIFGPQEKVIWKNFTALWASNTNTVLDLCVRNMAILSDGNNFAIDDISVRELNVIFDSVRVTANSGGALAAGPDTALCRGQSVQLAVSGGSSYSWQPAAGLSDPNSATPVASPDITTTYLVRSAPQGSNCGGVDSITITVRSLPRISVSGDTLLCSGGSVQLRAGGGTSYQWSPADGLSDPRVPDPVATPTTSTRYTVKVSDQFRCADTASVAVSIGAVKEVYIPNAFTPNGDGRNDCFRVPNTPGGGHFELSVYNRFGEKVFFSRDPLACWDGSYKGQRQMPGTYVYYVKLNSLCGSTMKKGTVQLIR